MATASKSRVPPASRQWKEHKSGVTPQLRELIDEAGGQTAFGRAVWGDAFRGHKGKVAKWYYGRSGISAFEVEKVLAAKLFENVSTAWIFHGNDVPKYRDQVLAGEDLYRDLTAAVLKEGKRAAKPPSRIRDVLSSIITRDVVEAEVRRVSLELVNRAWQMLERHRTLATVRAQLERDREKESLDENAAKALATIESEDYFASGEHGGQLGRAFHAYLLESARQEEDAKPAPRRLLAPAPKKRKPRRPK